MKRLLILLTAVMAVSADKAIVNQTTKQVKDLVDKASHYLEEARNLAYKSVAYNSRDNSTPDQACADKNTRDDLDETLKAIKKFNVNLLIRGTDNPEKDTSVTDVK